MYSTHMLGGAALWLGVCVPLPVSSPVVLAGVPVAAVMGLWPDWDHPQAAAARAFAPAFAAGARLVRGLSGRRTGAWAVTTEMVALVLDGMTVIARLISPVTYHLSRWVERRFGGHRAGTHSLLVGVPLCGLLGALAGLAVGWGAVTLSGASAAVLWPLVAVCGAASYVGALSHVLLDFVTCNCGGCDWKPRRSQWSGRHRAGCEILWPWVRRRFGVPALAVGSSTEDGFRRFVLPAVAALAAAGALVGW